MISELNTPHMFEKSEHMKKIAFLVALVLLVIAGCSPKDQYAGMSMKDICRTTGGMWMKMQPTQDFIPTGAPACEGCMQPNGDHICDKRVYLVSLK